MARHPSETKALNKFRNITAKTLQMKMYKTSYDEIITEVEVERFTDSSVWIAGRREGKNTHWSVYHDSFQDALKYLISRKTAKIENAKHTIQVNERYILNAHEDISKWHEMLKALEQQETI